MTVWFHWCRAPKDFMALRGYHEKCPFCPVKNPDWIPGTRMLHAVIDSLTNETIITFQDFFAAVKYVQKSGSDRYMLATIEEVTVSQNQ